MRLVRNCSSILISISMLVFIEGCTQESDVDIDSPEIKAEAAALVGSRRGTPITAEEAAEIKDVCDGIVEAYKNGQIGVMYERMACVSNQLDILSGESCFKFEGDLIRLCRRNFLNQNELRDFKSQADFEQYVRLNVKLVDFLLENALRQKNFGSAFDTWEGFTYRRLNEYRDKFQREKRADLQRSAEKYLAKWVEHIESERGFTRRCIVHEYERLRFGHKIGKIDSKIPLRYNLCLAEYLIGCGYTPKWLGEFK